MTLGRQPSGTKNKTSVSPVSSVQQKFATGALRTGSLQKIKIARKQVIGLRCDTIRAAEHRLRRPFIMGENGPLSIKSHADSCFSVEREREREPCFVFGAYEGPGDIEIHNGKHPVLEKDSVVIVLNVRVY